MRRTDLSRKTRIISPFPQLACAGMRLAIGNQKISLDSFEFREKEDTTSRALCGLISPDGWRLCDMIGRWVTGLSSFRDLAWVLNGGLSESWKVKFSSLLALVCWPLPWGLTRTFAIISLACPGSGEDAVLYWLLSDQPCCCMSLDNGTVSLSKDGGCIWGFGCSAAPADKSERQNWLAKDNLGNCRAPSGQRSSGPRPGSID